jgi:hypothetical protein
MEGTKFIQLILIFTISDNSMQSLITIPDLIGHQNSLNDQNTAFFFGIPAKNEHF